MNNYYLRRDRCFGCGQVGLMLEITSRPTKSRPPVISEGQTLAGILAFMLNPGSSDSIQHHHFLCAEALLDGHAYWDRETIASVSDKHRGNYFTWSLVVIDELANFDIILGQDWFHDFNPNVDFDFDNHVVHIEERFIHGREDSVTEYHAHLLKYLLHLF